MLFFKGLVGDVVDNFEGFFDNCDGQVGLVVDELSDVVFWYFWQLFLEDIFEVGQDDERFVFVVVVYNVEFDFVGMFFDDVRLLNRVLVIFDEIGV